MLQQNSKLLVFPLPPKSNPILDHNVDHVSNPPPRSNSIPNLFRSVVVNLSALQLSLQQIPSTEFHLSSHSNLIQFPRLSPPCIHHHQDPLQVSTPSNSVSSDDPTTPPSSCPMDYTHSELEQIVSTVDSKLIMNKVSTQNSRALTRELGESTRSSSNSSNHPSADSMENHHVMSTSESSLHNVIQRKPAITDRPRPIARGQSRRFLNRVAEFDQFIASKHIHPVGTQYRRPSLNASPYSLNKQTRLSQMILDPKPKNDHRITCKFEYSTPTTSNHKNLLQSTDTLPNRRCSSLYQYPCGRSKTFSNHTFPFDQSNLSHLMPHVQFLDSSLNPTEPEENLASLNSLTTDQDPYQMVLPKSIKWSLHNTRLSAMSCRSFIASLAKFDSDGNSLNLELQLPDQKLDLEINSSAKNLNSRSGPFQVNNPVRRNIMRLKKLTRTSTCRSNSTLTNRVRLSRLDKVKTNSSGPSCKSHPCSSVTNNCDKSSFKTHSSDKKFDSSRRTINFQRCYHKFKSVFIIRHHDRSRSHRIKQRHPTPPSWYL